MKQNAKAHILYVDDEEPNLVVFEAICGADFPVLTAVSAKDALNLMQKHEVAVILSDQRMPEMSGTELLHQVRLHYPHAIRLLITAYSDLDVAEDAINRGEVRRYLRKPWEPESLKAELRDAYDLYELRQQIQTLENKLLEAQNSYSLGMVAAGFSDEIRNPAAWVDSNLTECEAHLQAIDAVFSQPNPNLAHTRGLLAQTESSVADARLGIQQILTLLDGVQGTPGEHGGDVVNLGELIELTIRIAERGGLKRDAQVKISSEITPHVKGSRTTLAQITLNLLANAFQSVANRAEGEGIIQISTSEQGRFAILDVSDNGPGFPEDELDHIFHAFGSKGRVGGARLGLAISKRIAEELGGTLSAHNLPEGGARFRLSLPMA